MKCLLVAESMILRRIFKNAVESFDFEEVNEATDGKQAVAQCDETTSLVVTARDLPLMNGLELTKALRESQDTSKVRILMVAERKSRQDLLLAAEAGVNGYVVKPLSLPALKAKIERLLQMESKAAAEEPTDDEPEEAAPQAEAA